MQIQEAEQGGLGTSGALFVSRVFGETDGGGEWGYLEILIVSLSDLSVLGSRVGVGSFVEQVLAGLGATFDSLTMFRDRTATARMKTTLLFWFEITPGATERGMDRGVGVKAGFIADKVGPVDTRLACVSGSVDRDVHVASGSRVVFLGCFFQETKVLCVFPFFDDPFVDLSLVGEGLPVSVFVAELFINAAGYPIDKFLDGFGIGDGSFVLDGGDLVQRGMFADIQGDKFSAPFMVGVS
jgi:hypothetical protein